MEVLLGFNEKQGDFMRRTYVFWCTALGMLSLNSWADIDIIPCSNLALAGYGVRCNEIGDEEISKTMKGVMDAEEISLAETCNQVRSSVESFDRSGVMLGAYRNTAFFYAHGSEVKYVNCQKKPLEELDFAQSPKKPEIDDGEQRLMTIKKFFKI